MHSSGRDSGYCENTNTDVCDGAAPIVKNEKSLTAEVTAAPPSVVDDRLRIDRVEKCPREGVRKDGNDDGDSVAVGCDVARNVDNADEMLHIVSGENGEKIADCRITGSSCRALKHAVSNLTRLDDFVSVKIGNGFFSEVYKVTHQVTGRVMVLKMNLLRSNRANMLKEVQLMNRLSHPNILKFMGVCVHEGQLHALTEYINGGSLEQLIQSSRKLTYSVRMRLAVDIAKGMQYLHSQGVFHRDLTSKNVLIKKLEDSQEMIAVVGDFGLAAKIPRPGVRLPTVGSPWWMSPECLKGRCYDERSDIFSYGIVLCELIARVDADPDVLPRTSNFGLDYLAFVEICSQLSETPPPEFLKLAFSCCNLEPKNRPPFSDLVNILKKIVASSNINHYLLNRCTLTEAKSVEVLPCPSPSLIVPAKSKNNHRKLMHRRSLSEDMGLIVFPSANTPSEKARCHSLHPPLKRVGESMYHEDPHYKPSSGKSNPFASLSKFKGVKKVLAQTNSTDLFSSCFELPSPFYAGDDQKPSFYTDPKTITTTTSTNENRTDTIGTAVQLPYVIRKSSTKCKNVTKMNRSSIVIEPVIKPSEIRKCSSKTLFTSSSEEPDACKNTVVDADTNKKRTKAEWNTSNCGPASISSSSSSSSATLRCKAGGDSLTKIEKAISRVETYKPLSLPSSPTFSRRRLSSSCNFGKDVNFRLGTAACKAEETDEVESDASTMTNFEPKKAGSPVFSCPLYKSRGCLTDTLSPDAIGYGGLLRSCSSSSNIGALEECTNTVFLPSTETPTLNLRRRGSCESGFYSSVGDDFCVPGVDVCVGHHHYTASSVTLSSSSAASSLFLDSNSEDNSTPVFFGGRYPCTLHHHHHNASSVYTDSSEDVSSLASSETPVWDDRQKPQHISKIVEYFERKQVGGVNSNMSHKFDFLETSSRISNFHASARRNWIQSDGQPIIRSSLDYCTRRKLFEKPFSGGSHVLSKRSMNHRLLVCEGAVKSKLPIFDKK